MGQKGCSFNIYIYSGSFSSKAKELFMLRRYFQFRSLDPLDRALMYVFRLFLSQAHVPGAISM
jgi:hypothetical protein